MKISVVIPLHNEEPLIDTVGRNLQSQTHNDLEIIFVDDASTDGSLKKIETLRSQDSRISVVHLATNVGGGGSHNAGIDKATGDYIFILDADDQLVSDRSLEHLAEIASRNDDDIVMGNTLSLSQIADEYAKVELNKVTIRNVPALVYNHSVWNKLYRRSFLLENNIRFQEGKFAYDILYSARTNIAARSISITDRQTYFYSTGRQMTRATQAKITDARENAGRALMLFERVGDPRLADVARIKSLKNSFSSLARAERALTEDQLLHHLDRWREILRPIPEQTISLLPGRMADFHRQLRCEQLESALKTWRRSRGYVRRAKQLGFELLNSQLNTPKRPRLIRLAKSLAGRLSK